jgi:hypothetical protein
VSAPAWVGDHIYFISSVWPGMSWEEMTAELERRRKDHVSAHAWSALPTSSWDRWLDETRQAHLYRIPAAGGAVQAITLPTGWELPRSSQGRGSYDVAPDGSLVAFSADSRSDGVSPKMDLFLVRPGSDQATNITADSPAPDANPIFSPDGRRLAYTTQRIPGFYADTGAWSYTTWPAGPIARSPRTGTGPPTGWSGPRTAAASTAPSTTPARAASITSPWTGGRPGR